MLQSGIHLMLGSDQFLRHLMIRNRYTRRNKQWSFFFEREMVHVWDLGGEGREGWGVRGREGRYNRRLQEGWVIRPRALILKMNLYELNCVNVVCLFVLVFGKYFWVKVFRVFFLFRCFSVQEYYCDNFLGKFVCGGWKSPTPLFFQN